ncbi:TetR/AcrR family transcriptional regulator [Actinoalloteichus sp. AHMU CJ021]|uniref:Transcriptional regulator, TetR family n=1 Tax=Actinoalloteichus caeruleus DSM 43889 TaxID=1120930 RepID=A0ABT1JKN9_ACTCY|nr:TetR/AcrR family transcriptional regulator [Actinoalloteichus caeruleus]AUS78740.1 TetR/AcrR family transcriptional regulator [Actinoalloteichus sp. AHMU CJ021]MCP2332897.1 transcriptional regulator, TetR family [Actinoalloteichus caeruleus DSM 43889]
MAESVSAEGSRSEAKRELMLERALEAFVANGYVGTSTDQLAAAASVSKQTLYKAFGDKEGVFTALIRAECDRVHNPFLPLVERMAEVGTAEEAVRALAERFARSIMNPRVQQLRRLVIAEATRFPQLGLLYWERGFLPMLDAVGRCLSVLDVRGLLDVPEPVLAANHFAGMLLWIPSNQTMFAAATRPVSEAELAPALDAGVEAFLRAYRRDAVVG